MNRKTLLVVAAFALATPLPSLAQQSLPDDVVTAMRQWSECQVRAIQHEGTSTLSADAVADQAFQRCGTEEIGVLSALHLHFGDAQDKAFYSLKASNRKRAVELIDSQRSRKPINDPVTAWGSCLGEDAAKRIRTSDSIDEIAGRAFHDCSSLEQPVERSFGSKMSSAQTRNLIDQTRQTMRGQVLTMLFNARGKLVERGAAATQAPRILDFGKFTMPYQDDPMLHFYPSAARTANIQGNATIKCDIAEDDRLTQCKILSEDPVGYGFGEATIRLLSLATLKPETVQNLSGGPFVAPVHWKLH